VPVGASHEVQIGTFSPWSIWDQFRSQVVDTAM